MDTIDRDAARRLWLKNRARVATGFGRAYEERDAVPALSDPLSSRYLPTETVDQLIDMAFNAGWEARRQWWIDRLMVPFRVNNPRIADDSMN